MYIDDIDNRAPGLAQFRKRCLRQEQWRFEVNSDQVVPVRRGDFSGGCRVKTRCIVDEKIEPSFPLRDLFNDRRKPGRIAEVSLNFATT